MILDAFSIDEVVEIFEEKLREVESQKTVTDKDRIRAFEQFRAQLYQQKDTLVRESVWSSPDIDWFFDSTISNIEEEIRRINSKIRSLQISAGIVKVDPTKTFDIAGIKRKSIITEVFTLEKKENRKYLCPLHEEKTPSFTVYEKTNTWYCFGCGQGGDVISLYMKVHDCDFKTACQTLMHS